MTRATLTDTQADALRMLVGDARCRDDGLQLGRTTDRNLREINGRVAKALHEAGLVHLIAPQRPHPPGKDVAIATDEGRAWVRFDEGVAAGTEQLIADATSGLGDEARAELEAAALADHLEDQEQDTLLDDEESSVGLEAEEAGAAELTVAPANATVRLFEGIRIVSDQLKVTSAKLVGGADLRHGDEAVVVLVVHVDDIQHPGGEAGVTRTVVAKPSHGYLLDEKDGTALVDALARLRAARTAGGNTLLDPDDDPAADLADVIDRLNREELEVRDEDGRRDWDDEDDLPTADAVDDLLATAEARRPQWRVEPGTGDNDGRWVVGHPLGDVPITESFPTDGDAIAAVEERTGPMKWDRTRAGVFIGFEEVA